MPRAEPPSWAEGVARHGAVVAGNADAVDAGMAILTAGGNAFDAIVAAAYAMGVVEPLDNGIGGGGFATIYVA
ncbi:MAG: gamma-glutamyltransferase, partial [Rhodospirillaceae bacterium]